MLDFILKGMKTVFLVFIPLLKPLKLLGMNLQS